MKAYNPRLITCSVLATLCMIAPLSKAAVIITDNFSDNPVGLTTVGGQITPSYSANGTKWIVDSGAFSTDGTQFSPATPAGELAFSNITAGTRIHIDLGNVTPNTASSFQFSLAHAYGVTAGGNYVDAVLGNYTTGTFYTIRMTLLPNYFGSSGFAISRPPTPAIFTGGVAGQSLVLTPAFSTMLISFDPVTGVSLTQNGLTVATSAVAPPAGFDKVDYFALSNGNQPVLRWSVDNVVINAVPEPAAALLMGSGLLGLLALRRWSVA